MAPSSFTTGSISGKHVYMYLRQQKQTDMYGNTVTTVHTFNTSQGYATKDSTDHGGGTSTVVNVFKYMVTVHGNNEIRNLTYASSWIAVFKATYDAWGKQNVTVNSINYHRGYTGHVHLPEFELIGMGGRMYDPVLGRFLSPDPYVQDPEFSQSFNRYSYAFNNPLMYVDPDGEFIFKILGSLFGPVGTAIGAFLDAACWGATISAASYTASVIILPKN